MTTATACAQAFAAIAENLDDLGPVSITLMAAPWEPLAVVDMQCLDATSAQTLAGRLCLGEPSYRLGDGRVHCTWKDQGAAVAHRVVVILPAGTADIDAAVAAELTVTS